MENLKKESIKKFGVKRYLLGIRKEDGKKVYLTKATWDCGWYWGFGYIDTFQKNDIYDHQHFSDLFLKENIFNSFKEYFEQTPLTNDEIWLLLSYMKEFYIAKRYAELLRHGGYISSQAISFIEEKNKIENEKEINRINQILLPELFEKIYELLKEA